MSPLQAERLHAIDIQIAGLEVAATECTKSQIVVGRQKMEFEIRKAKRVHRGLVRESPNVAEAFRQNRLADFHMMREQQLHLAAANDNEAQRKLNHDELVATTEKIAEAKSALAKIEDIMDESKAAKRVTAEFLGKGCKNVCGKQCFQRRADILDRYAQLGARLPAEQRNNFGWF